MQRGGKARSVISHPKKRAFLAAYAKCGNVTVAAEQAEISRKAHYEWMQADPIYAEWFEDAHEEAIQRMEAEARRRAVEGVMKPVFYKGEIVGYVNEYSDNLLMFNLKAARSSIGSGSTPTFVW
jgi:argininosuccinate synthase